MAFDDIFARDPKSEEEFWTIIEETFVLIEGALTDYPVETREEALDDTLPLRGGNSKDTSVSIIRYRGVDKDIDSRDYFLELGREFLLEVKQQIEARVLTPKFAKDWGVVMMCHGFISAHILDDSDGLFHARAGRRSSMARNTDPQKKWVARQILSVLKPARRHLTRKQADAWLAKEISQLIERGKFPNGFDKSWFESVMQDGALGDAFSQKRLSMEDLHALERALDDIPPINFSQ